MLVLLVLWSGKTWCHAVHDIVKTFNLLISVAGHELSLFCVPEDYY